MRKADVVTGLAFLGFSVGYWLLARALPESPSIGDPGAGELPKLVAAVCAIASFALVVKGIRGEGNASAPEGQAVFPAKGIAFLAWSLLAAIALPVLHTPVALFLYVFGGVIIQLGARGWKLALFCAPVVTGVVYALFQTLLGVPLP